VDLLQSEPDEVFIAAVFKRQRDSFVGAEHLSCGSFCILL